MQPVSAFVIFIMIWWVVLFCVLPIGLSTTEEKTENTEETHRAPGAPTTLNIKRKMFITTAISIILWTISYVIIEMELINLREWAQADM